MTWPLLTVAADRGTDGLCAMAYLRRALNINLDELPDPSHDVTNDVTLAIQRAGLWPHEVLMQAWGRDYTLNTPSCISGTQPQTPFSSRKYV